MWICAAYQVASAENGCQRCGDVIANLHLQIRELQRDLKEQMQWKEDLASDDHQKDGSCETSPQHQHDLVEDIASHSANPDPYKVPTILLRMPSSPVCSLWAVTHLVKTISKVAKVKQALGQNPKLSHEGSLGMARGLALIMWAPSQ